MPKKQPKKRTQALAVITTPEPVSFWDWPGTIERVCARVCAGGTLVDFCKEFNQNYQAVLGWIEENEARRDRYVQALRVREHHLREMVYRDLLQLRALDPAMWTYDTGAIKPLHEIPEGARRWIAKLETMDYFEGAGNHRIKIGELKKVSMFDKLRAIELLTKLLMMIDESKPAETGARTLEDILADSRRPGESMTLETVTATRMRIGS